MGGVLFTPFVFKKMMINIDDANNKINGRPARDAKLLCMVASVVFLAISGIPTILSGCIAFAPCCDRGAIISFAVFAPISLIFLIALLIFYFQYKHLADN